MKPYIEKNTRESLNLGCAVDGAAIPQVILQVISQVDFRKNYFFKINFHFFGESASEIKFWRVFMV